MIKGIDLCKSFDGFQALDHADFHVEKGTVYGLVGPNGAGKSTLLRIISGVFRADSGSVLIDGEEVFENPQAKAKMAFIPDDVFFFRQASVLDMKKYYQGIYPGFDEKMFEQLLPCFPALDPKGLIRKMSKGMQKQAAFLLTISVCPQILLLDEPVDGLDPVMRRQIWKVLLDAVSTRQMTVMVSSHNLRELEDVCDHVGILHRGKIMLERSLLDLQGSVSKVQVAFTGEMPQLTEDIEVMNQSRMGKVYTLIVKGEPQRVRMELQRHQPLLLEQLPLTLEEIFIYELGGEEYAVKDIVL